jgi:predicted ATPase
MVTGMTLVGRTAELALVERMLEALPEGPGRVLAISGEPGIGKTRLLMELRGRAARRGYIVLSGRGTELETEEPFAALVEALDDFLASLEPRRLQTLSKRLPHLSEVLPTFGALAETTPGPAGERYRHHRAIQALLEELAATRPLVLMLDDVHWADAASLICSGAHRRLRFCSCSPSGPDRSPRCSPAPWRQRPGRGQPSRCGSRR